MGIGRRSKWFGLRLAILTLFFATNASVGAEDDPWAEFAKETARFPAPPGLTLHISTPRNVYFTGEPIPITLTYEMAGPGKAEIWMGEYDRGGRISDLSWYVVGPDGRYAPDPIEGLTSGFEGGIGMTAVASQGHSVTQTFYVNEWAWFGQPGAYEIAVISFRSDRLGGGGGVASDRIKVSISPATDKQINDAIRTYESIIERRQSDLSAKDGLGSRKAMLFLRFLHHEKAISCYLKYLNSDELQFDAVAGLVGIPDKQKSLKALFDRFTEKDFPIRSWPLNGYQTIYASLNPPPAGETRLLGQLSSKETAEIAARLRPYVAAKSPSARAVSLLTLGPAPSKTDAEKAMEMAQYLKDLSAHDLPQALVSLSSMNNLDVVPYIEPFLNHEDKYVRSYAIEALGRLGVLKYIIMALDDWTSPTPAITMSRPGVPSRFPEKYQLKLAELLGNADDSIAKSAVYRLAQVASSRAILPHIVRVRDRFTGDPAVFASLLQSWAKVDSAGAKNDLFAFIRSNKEHSFGLLPFLKNFLNDPEVLSYLLERAGGQEKNYSALQILSEAKRPEVVPVILEQLRQQLRPNTVTGLTSELSLASGLKAPPLETMDNVEQQKAALDEWEANWKQHKRSPAETQRQGSMGY